MTCSDCDGAGCPECTAPKYRSGTVWTEQQRQAHGYHQVKVRLPLDAIELLDRLVDAVDDHEEERGEGEPKASRGVVLDTIIRYMTEVERREPGELAAAIRLRRA